MQVDHALHHKPKSMSHSYVRIRSIKKISSQFAEKRPGKYKFIQENLPTEILENRDVPIFLRCLKSKIGTVLIKLRRQVII